MSDMMVVKDRVILHLKGKMMGSLFINFPPTYHEDTVGKVGMNEKYRTHLNSFKLIEHSPSLNYIVVTRFHSVLRLHASDKLPGNFRSVVMVTLL